MFNDFTFRDEVRLAGVNSINWARVLAQVVYYFTAAVSAGCAAPQGQLYRAHRQFRRHLCGLPRQADGPADRAAGGGDQPQRHLHRALSRGITTHGVTPSISPSMDIQVSSNFERALFDAYHRDGAAVAQLMDELKARRFPHQPRRAGGLARGDLSGRAREDETSAMIAPHVLAEMGELLVPAHSAVGVHVAQEACGIRCRW
jgi:threonine synthase